MEALKSSCSLFHRWEKITSILFYCQQQQIRKMPIVVNMACGLANRMFQYTYYRYLLSQGIDAKVDYFTSAVLAHEEVAWNDIFPLATFEQAEPELIRRTGFCNSVVHKAIRKFLPFMTKVREMPDAFALYEPKNGMCDRYLLGVFQNAKPAQAMEIEIRELFQFPDLEPGNNLKLVFQFKNEESVAVHVRKGNDYQSRKWYQNTCPLGYYLNAVELMKKKLNTPKFYVFTDNPKWVNENFKDFDYTLVEGNPVSGWGSHFDMQLMSLCRHNIISNSTYSWWSAFLNSNPQKNVIMPKIWFNPVCAPHSESDRLQCKGWDAI